MGKEYEQRQSETGTCVLKYISKKNLLYTNLHRFLSITRKEKVDREAGCKDSHCKGKKRKPEGHMENIYISSLQLPSNLHDLDILFSFF